MLKRRKFPRVKAGWAVEYRTLDDAELGSNPVKSLTLDISGGGISFEAEEEMAPGTKVAINLRSPDFDEPILAVARVVWCRKRLFSEVFEVGAEFLWTGWGEPPAQSRVAEWVERHLPSDARHEG